MDNNQLYTIEADNPNIHDVNNENNLQNLNINNSNNLDLLPTNVIQELNRNNNEETQALLRRVVAMQNNSLRNEVFDFEEIIFNLIISNKVFIHSSLSLIIIGFLFYLELINLSKINNFSIKHLESEEMWYLYSLGFLIILISLWSIYLLIFKLFSLCDSFINFRKDKMNEYSSAEMLFFNPFYINMMIVHYNKTYIGTVFDFYILMTISMAFSINYFFTNYYNNYLKKQINSISNIHLTKNKLLYFKIKCFYIFLIAMNMLISYLISFITEAADIYFLYILQIKSLYLILRQIALWYETETSYKQLDSYYATNEEYYLDMQLIKMILNIIAAIILVQALFFANLLFFKEGDFAFLIPNSLVCCTSCYGIFSIFKKYDDIRTFFDKLHLIFPQINLNDNDHECIICTETLTKARKLSCNHFFHLICLSKWIENGKKNCPLCRKDISWEEEYTSDNPRREYRFEFNFSNRIFSWFPQISIRLSSFNRSPDINIF